MPEAPTPPPLYPLIYEATIRRALEEDLGLAGDLTADSVAASGTRARARVVARRAGRIAGLQVSLSAFTLLDPSVSIQDALPDGSDVQGDATLALVEGPARPLLSAERTALNVLGRLSGIATATRDVVAAVGDYPAKITCTRKTTPGLRALEKYAVRVGGGANHRFGLDDAVLIKDNHRAVAGGLAAAVERARARLGHMVKIEVEVDSLEELEELLALDVDAVLFDNMAPESLRRAVRRVGGRMVTEASGGITLENVREIAATGVDLISLGWLTHSVTSLDVALDLEAV